MLYSNSVFTAMLMNISINLSIYYENHPSVKWARITESLPCPLLLNILMKFLSHGLKVYYNDCNKRNLSLFSLAIAEKLATKKPVVKSPPFPIMGYNLHSQASHIIEAFPKPP